MARILSGAFVFLLVAVATPRDSLWLRSHYGRPDVERFALRPDITLTVEYGMDGRAGVLSIAPRQAFIHQSYFPQPTMSEETAQTLLAELAPPATRGMGGAEVGIQSSANVIRMFHYENVGISESVVATPTTSSVREASVRFNRPQNTSTDFHDRYGQPDVERFAISADVQLTAEYGQDERACRMRIETRGTGTMDEVRTVLNELLPDMRGDPRAPLGRVWNSCYGALPPDDYESVTVVPIYRECKTPLIDRGVDVLFKRPICRNLPKYSESGASGNVFPVTDADAAASK